MCGSWHRSGGWDDQGSRFDKTNGLLVVLLILTGLTGCGTLKSQTATQQLLLSDAVDRSIASIDFSPLSGKTIYLDITYIQAIKGFGFVNASYIISSLRQQLFAADCLIQEDRIKAEYVVEVRVGTLGNDSHDITYGIPASNTLAKVSSVVSNSLPVPTLPEVSLARRSDQTGAAKIFAFAYDRETREPIWQSGVAQARSTSRDTWLLGAGPFQRGTIHEGMRFAGSQLAVPRLGVWRSPEKSGGMNSYSHARNFLLPKTDDSLHGGMGTLQPASFEEQPLLQPSPQNGLPAAAEGSAESKSVPEKPAEK